MAACSDDTPDDARVRLRFHYDIGDTLHYEYATSGTVVRPDSTATGGTATETYDRRMRIEEVATAVTPRGNYMLAWTYHLPPDTAGAEVEIPMRFTLNVEITPQGRIVDVQNFETAKPFFGDMDFRAYLEQTQPVFPERPLAVGDSWTQEVKVLTPEAEPVVTSSTYVLEGLRAEGDESMAVIAFDGDVYLPTVYEPAERGTGQEPHSVEERIEVRGRMLFAHGPGIVRRVEASAQATLTRTFFRGGDPQRREMQIDQQSTLRLIQP